LAGSRDDRRRGDGERRPDSRHDHVPGGYPKVIAVGSTGIVAPAPEALANISSRGPGPGRILKPDLVAPGGTDEE